MFRVGFNIATRVAVLACIAFSSQVLADTHLPPWNDVDSRNAIVDFVGCHFALGN